MKFRKMLVGGLAVFALAGVGGPALDATVTAQPAQAATTKVCNYGPAALHWSGYSNGAWRTRTLYRNTCHIGDRITLRADYNGYIRGPGGIKDLPYKVNMYLGSPGGTWNAYAD